MSAHDTHLTQSGAEVQALLDKIDALGPIPTALADLTDDSTHRVVTDSEKSAWGAKYDKPGSGIPASDLASGVIPDVSEFITKSVNDLTNYYLKSETYTQAEIDALIGGVNGFHYEIYTSTSAVDSPSANVLYLIGPTGAGADKYEEYVYSSNTWVKIGDTSIDLSGYATTASLATVATSGAYNDLSGRPIVPDNLFAQGTGSVISVVLRNQQNTASGTGSIALGYNSESSGVGAFSLGDDTEAGGYDSVAVGYGTKAGNYVETALGKYNKSTTTNEASSTSSGNTLLSVGIGTDDTHRKNAEETMQNGDKYLLGVGGYDGTNFSSASTVQDVINAKYEKPVGGIPASDMASGVIPDAVEANPTVPSGTTPTSLTGLKIGDGYYNIEAGGGTVTDVTVGGTSVVDGNGVAVVPAIPTVNDATLTIKMNNASKGTFSANAASNTEIDLGTVITSHQDISGKADKVTGATNGHFAGLDSNGNLTDSGKSASDFGTYSKPSGGIPKTDLASAVQTSLGKADSALQSSDITGKEDKSNKVSAWSGTTTDDHYPSEKLVKDSLDAKQATISDLSDIRSGAAAGATAYQKPSGGIPSTDLASAVQTSLGKANSAYQKPSGGIPSTDLASAVQTSLGKADSAYQKPSGGIPASDMASGVIPTLNMLIVAVGYDDEEEEYIITNDVTFADICDAYDAGKGILLVYTDADGYASEYTLSDYAADDDYITFSASQSPELVKTFTVSSDDSVEYSEQRARTSALTNDSLFVRGEAACWNGTCATAAGTAAKYVNCSSFTADDQSVGVMVVVTFSNTNAAAPNILTLNVQSRGAKPIKRWVNGGLADIDKPENLTGTMAFVYDGTNWITWYESFDDIDGNCLDAKFGNVSLHQWKPDYTMTEGSYVKGADGLLYTYTGAKYVEVAVGDAERVRFLGLYPKYSSWTNGWAFGKYVNDEWVTIESEKFEYDTSQDASYTKEYIKDVPSGATHFRTSSASSSLYALERQFYLYFQTGKPAVSQEELEDAVNPTIGTTQPSGGFLPNKVYDLGTLTGTVTFALATPTDNTRPNPYHWTFDTGSTAPTVSMPANLTWAGDGTPPTIEANYHYEIFVRKGYASYLAFDIS